MLAVLLLLALPAAGGCMPRPSQAVDDATLMVRVKTALLNDPTIGAMRIEVDVTQGVVTLSGQVQSERDIERAVGLARHIAGVREVKSGLQIAPGNAGGRERRTQQRRTENVGRGIILQALARRTPHVALARCT